MCVYIAILFLHCPKNDNSTCFHDEGTMNEVVNPGKISLFPVARFLCFQRLSCLPGISSNTDCFVLMTLMHSLLFSRGYNGLCFEPPAMGTSIRVIRQFSIINILDMNICLYRFNVGL